ncbi:transglutaminase domain-containing protein [Pseudorhodobacter sp. MZDSW-24AT]|uniref:transglutaminase domain-containing protein n=1 Tax=Pseudorhodobacter sp. MZDSW-24AT TaxID=2052957 RepID=UPI000C1F2383|nr:hypothetical protein CUR21_16355 [Pseudorhodobacter sp. MZDSW-24AT]
MCILTSASVTQTPQTRAGQMMLGGAGVSRGLATPAITLCRCLTLPARYVNGHLGGFAVPVSAGPRDCAAWMKAALGGAWHPFDLCNVQRRIGVA